MMNRFLLAAGLLLACNAAEAQQAGFTKTKSGLEYKIVKDVPGNKPTTGDFLLVHMLAKSNGQVLSDSRQMPGGEPQPIPVADPKFNGDPAEVINMLSAGDSAVIIASADSFRKVGMQLPETFKTIEMYVTVAGIKTAAQMEAEQAKKEEEAKKQAALQPGIDDKLIQDYLKKNKIKAEKTASGLYYKIEAPGTGEVIKPGQTADVMYIGKLLNGKVFDANMGPEAKRDQPIQVNVGKGMVIKGWDEGLSLLRKGSKATFYIPSQLAYGPQARGADITANSILIFDVEIRDVK
jgi:FKBP-type peptidyl-prolyl cis-trans isomerase FkpA